jgi:hypothetical protein
VVATRKTKIKNYYYGSKKESKESCEEGSKEDREEEEPRIVFQKNTPASPGCFLFLCARKNYGNRL